MRQNMLNKKLILAALGFSLTAAACGPGGEGAEPQPVSQQSASQALTANAGGMAASLEESLKFLDSSQLFQSALDGVGVPYRILAGTARNFEYYTGITFRFLSGDRTVLVGARHAAAIEWRE